MSNLHRLSDYRCQAVGSLSETISVKPLDRLSETIGVKPLDRLSETIGVKPVDRLSETIGVTHAAGQAVRDYRCQTWTGDRHFCERKKSGESTSCHAFLGVPQRLPKNALDACNSV